MKRRTTISALALAILAISAASAGAQAPTPPEDPTQPTPPVQQRVVISGLPSSCTRSSFVARVSLQPPTAPVGTRGNSSIRVTLDRRRVLRTTAQASFGVRVPVRELRPGLHRIGVSVTGRAGNLEELRGARRFRRCR